MPNHLNLPDLVDVGAGAPAVALVLVEVTKVVVGAVVGTGAAVPGKHWEYQSLEKVQV